MASALVARSRSNSVNSVDSADSYQVLSGVGDDWETLSASPSETGATVLSEDESGAEGPKPRAKASPATASQSFASQPPSVPAPQHTSHELDESHVRGPLSSRVDDLSSLVESQGGSTPRDARQEAKEPTGPTASVSPRLATSTGCGASSSLNIFVEPDSPISAASETLVDTTHVQPHPTIPIRERRVWMHTSRTLPLNLIANAPFVDADGSPVMIGSALVDGAVHPCKITLSRLGDAGFSPVRMAYRGSETVHFGVYEVLEVNEDTMEWVSARDGRLPRGRAPVEGGYDREGRRFYYAVTTIKGFGVPGKASEHDNAHFAYGGRVHVKREDYRILCWRPQYYVPDITHDPWEVEHAPFTDSGGQAPVHVVSVPYGKTLQPGKATLHPDAVRVRIPYLWREVEVDWTADERPLNVLHVDPDAMDWISTSHGRIPVGVQPVEGGYDKTGERFYHAICTFNGVTVPGKTGEHLCGARFPWNGIEHSIECEYKILCWKPVPGASAYTSLIPPPPTLLLSDALTPATRILNPLTPDGMNIGLAHHSDGSRHPGTVVRGSLERMLYAHGGRAILGSSGAYDVLVYEENVMEWVPAREGRAPADRRPVEAGYERNGKKLWFARYMQAAPYVFGKTGEHLQSAHFVRDGQELKVRAGYDVLCWKDA
ncbi:unnamed protein product [Peniophora sp. CBMAI 1063]|nr:unnamed protein product [Peniophora sp. CBMAI 1063]